MYIYVFLCKPVEKGKNVDYLCVNIYGSRGHIFHVTAITARASWRLHYHRHKNTVKIIILNNLPFSNLNDSNKQQCWYMIKSSKKPFLLHMIWSRDQGSSYEKVKGRWFELRCGHFKLCIMSFDKALYLHCLRSSNCNQVSNYTGWGLPAMSWCPFQRRGGGWKPLIRIFLYIFYNLVCRKDYMVIYSAYICLNRSYIFNVNAYLALHCFSFFNKWISKLS